MPKRILMTEGKKYIDDGLLLHFNASSLQGNGLVDLVNGNIFTPHNISVADNALKFNGTNAYAVSQNNIAINSNTVTIEFCDNGDMYQQANIGIVIPIESSPVINNNANSFIVDMNEKGTRNFIFVRSFGKGVLHGYNTTGGFSAGKHTFTFIIGYNIYECYIDGIQQNKALFYTGSQQNYNYDAQAIYLGCRGGQSMFTKMGVLDFRLYNRRLSDVEIINNYNTDNKL